MEGRLTGMVRRTLGNTVGAQLGEKMSLVTVYAYRVYNAEQGAYVRADPFATMEIIKEKGWQLIVSEFLEVDASQIFDRRYHPPSKPRT